MATQQAPTRATVGPYLALGAVWLATRLAMLVLLVRDDLGAGGVSREVYVLYARWYEELGRGAFPFGDATWQYPPGAAAVFLAPGLVPWLSYFQAFVALTLLADAAVTLALARAGGERGTAAWLWTGGLALLLHVPLARYDVQVTALAVFSLLALRRRPRLGGAVAGLGATVKVWPALTLLGTAPGRTTRAAWASAAASAAALLAVLTLAFPHTLDFLRQQGARGVQIESLGGTALALARLLGADVRVAYRYGAFEFTGPYVTALARLSLLLTAVAFCALLRWRMRAEHRTAATPFDAALCAVLLFTVTSRVISPQYLVWLLGLASVCLVSRETTQRPVALLLLPAAALSSVIYPVLYEDVVACTPLGCTLLVLRNALLGTAAWLSWRRL